MSKRQRYYLYWIHRAGLTNIKEQGYIGITKNPDKRFVQHRSNAKRGFSEHLYKAMRKYNDIEFEVLCLGSLEYILYLERKLRPRQNIGWNELPGGESPWVGISKKKSTITNHAESMTKVDKLTVLNIWYDYFEKGLPRKDIENNYKIGQWSVWNITSGNSKAYPELEETRQAFIKNRKFNSSHRGSLPEELYDEILKGRESGKTFVDLGEEYNIPSRTVRNYCKGKLKYLKNFSCYRVAN